MLDNFVWFTLCKDNCKLGNKLSGYQLFNGEIFTGCYHLPGFIQGIAFLQQNRPILCPHEVLSLWKTDSRYLNGHIDIWLQMLITSMTETEYTKRENSWSYIL